ncbi:MAG: hypothetical protein ABJA74_13420 [Lapillicoccus sp.]
MDASRFCRGAARARPAALLHQGGAQAVRDRTEQVTDSGYATEPAAKLMDNPSGDVGQFTGSVETAFIRADLDAAGLSLDKISERALVSAAVSTSHARPRRG